MKKVFKKLHLWLSVPFGLIVTLVCFSGAMLVFENEVNELRQPELYFVEKEPDALPIPLDKLMESVSATLPDSVEITEVSISSDPERTYQVSLSKPRRASLYVNPYTGEIKGRNERAPFFTFMFRLHRWLLDSVTPGGGFSLGKTIVGVSTLLFVIILITGIVIWWPRTLKSLKQRLKISVHHGWRRFWYDLHAAGGMYVLIFLLAMALTGLTWSFPWYRSAFYGLFGVTEQQQSPHGGSNPQSDKKNLSHERTGQSKPNFEGRERGERKGNRPQRDKADRPRREKSDGLQQREERIPEKTEASMFQNWQKVYDELCRLNPKHTQITVSAGTANVSSGGFGNQRASDRYTFDVGSGEITDITLYQNQDKSGKIRGWIYSVHVGSWGGLLTRILAFIAALIGASLPLTGYYLWIKRLKSKH